MRRAIIIAALYYLSKRKKKVRRRLHVHPLIEQRAVAGEFVTLYGTLRADETKFFNYFRMSTRTFDELLAKTDYKLVHSSLRRVPIPPIERLMVTLRFARMDRGAHMRRHRSARPHACAVCHRTFSTAAGLRTHTRRHTGTTTTVAGERPFECASCSQMFPTKSHLVKHLKKHEGKKTLNKPQSINTPKLQPVEYIVSLNNPTKMGEDVETVKSEKATELEFTEVPLEVTGELVIQGDGELLVVHNSPNENSSVYLNSNECNNFVNDLNLIAVDGDGTQASVVEGTTVKLYQIDQSLVQIHTSDNQMTISKICSK